MTLAQITRPAVLAAVAEFDRLGRNEFLRATGFSKARSYYLELDGRLYDSKAIVGYAHGVATGTYLRPADFSGGDSTVADCLRKLDFVVLNLKNPDWTRDEIILACDLVEQQGWKEVGATDPRVVELSRLLQAPAIHPLNRRGPDFRNPAGVARKTADIATRHPDYTGRPTNGNRLDQEVLSAFLSKPNEMRALATAIRAVFVASAAADHPALTDVDLGDMNVTEGGLLERRHLRRERDPKIRQAKILDAKKAGVAIACEVCGFDFAAKYGTRGIDYIECHHRTPLHVTGPTRTRLDDLALLCSNCHRMIHRTAPWLTVEELREIVTQAAERRR